MVELAFLCRYVQVLTINMVRDIVGNVCHSDIIVVKETHPFLEGPEMFSHPESRIKISNLMIKEPFYSCILNMNRGSLHTSHFRPIHLSVFRFRLLI